MARKKKEETENVDKEVGKVEDKEQVDPKNRAESEEGAQSSTKEQGSEEVRANTDTDEPTAEDAGAEQKGEPEGDKKEVEKEDDVTAKSEQKDDSSEKETKGKEDAKAQGEKKDDSSEKESKGKEDAKAQGEKKDEPEGKKEKTEEAVGKKEEKGKKKGKKDKKKEELPPGAHLEPMLVEESDKRVETDDDVAARYEAEEKDSKEPGKSDVAKGESEEASTDAKGEEGEEEAKSKSKPINIDTGKIYQATGKRKRSIARVNLKAGSGEMVVNNHTVKEYFPRDVLQHKVFEPLRASGAEGQVDVTVRVHGGGVAGQAQAVGHGIARALVSADPELRGILKKRGHLTRDSRVKERRKAGFKKARKRPQFSKR